METKKLRKAAINRNKSFSHTTLCKRGLPVVMKFCQRPVISKAFRECGDIEHKLVPRYMTPDAAKLVTLAIERCLTNFGNVLDGVDWRRPVVSLREWTVELTKYHHRKMNRSCRCSRENIIRNSTKFPALWLRWLFRVSLGTSSDAVVDAFFLRFVAADENGMCLYRDCFSVILNHREQAAELRPVHEVKLNTALVCLLH